ncbi:hypothetical protein DPMN_194955 [Dreissena polymorpha]|uniref:Uncharacterized protein n=1 Tax=Dreissena polymorpha TaxID=45954 RepID=A0A9D3Y1S1_DREPO|nr:hypothetical protein DPMN_194955 [Dreissena polymorpha]
MRTVCNLAVADIAFCVSAPHVNENWSLGRGVCRLLVYFMLGRCSRSTSTAM